MTNSAPIPFRFGEGASRNAQLSLPQEGIGYFLYMSQALVPEEGQQTDVIVTSARDRNGDTGITGFLHREEDLFFQYVEGPVDALRDLWDRLNTDGRHTNIRLLVSGALAKRYFADWRMGFTTRVTISLFDWLSNSAIDGTGRGSTGEDVLDFMRMAAGRV